MMHIFFRYQGRGGWHERTNRNKFQHGNENQRSSWQPEERNNNNIQQNKFTKQERNEESKQSPSKQINHGCMDCSSAGSKGTIMLLIILIVVIF